MAETNEYELQALWWKARPVGVQLELLRCVGSAEPRRAWWTRRAAPTHRRIRVLWRRRCRQPVWTRRSRSRGRCPNGSQRIRPASMIIMSNIIETLLLRNLQEVFGEGDPERRRSAIEELYTEDCVVNLAVGQYHGHDALDRICGELRASHPSYIYTPHNAPIVYRTADVSTGVLDPQANRRDTRVSTSSLPVTTRFQPFMSSSTPRRSEAGS